MITLPISDKRPPSPLKFVCVHQGYELYGSDRTFISSVTALRARFPLSEIAIVLPRKGALTKALEALGFTIVVEKMWVARKADGIITSTIALLAFPLYVANAARRMRNAKLTYINTSVVFDYAVASRLTARPTLLHVHEIPTGIALRVIRYILRFSKANLVYNSATTKRAFDIPSSRRQAVLLNGVTVPPANQAPATRRGGTRTRVLMIGRMNSWKGQDILVEAVAGLADSLQQRVEVKFAGAAFEGRPEAKQLEDLVHRAGLSSRIQFEGFVEDPSPLYQWADVVVVPSKKPEPFGLVAIEAMAHGRAVIAANHGGLSEIVVSEETGFLFTPGDARALCEMLGRAIENPEELRAFGFRGQARYQEYFTEDAYKKSFVLLVEDIIKNADAME